MGLLKLFRHPVSEEDQLLKGLIEKLKQQDPKMWSVEDFGGHEIREPCHCARIYYTHIGAYQIGLAQYIKESKDEFFHYHRLSVWEGERCIAKFTGEKIKKLYSKIDPEVRKYKKSTFEIEQEQKAAEKIEKEKARQMSLTRLREFLLADR